MSHQNDNASERGATQGRQDAGSTDKKPNDRRADDTSGNDQDQAGERLDEALEETFPSSDPVSVKVTK